jgi:hypothetical protein
MRKRRKAFVWTFVGLLVVVGAFLIFTRPQLPRVNQPVYNGRTLVQWLDTTTRVGANRGYYTTQQVAAAEDAVRVIGTNAFPSLLEWTHYKTSSAKRFFFFAFDETPMPGPARGMLWGLSHRREQLAELGVQGFRILHTNAFAFETLSKMANDTNNPLTQIPAAKALITVTNTPDRNKSERP